MSLLKVFLLLVFLNPNLLLNLKAQDKILPSLGHDLGTLLFLTSEFLQPPFLICGPETTVGRGSEAGGTVIVKALQSSTSTKHSL